MQTLYSATAVTTPVVLGHDGQNVATLYGCAFSDGTVSKTFAGSQTFDVTFPAPIDSSSSVVAEIFINGVRFETYIVQNLSGIEIEPYYLENGLSTTKRTEAYDDSPMLYMGTTDPTSIPEGVLLSALPTTDFDPLSAIHLVYDGTADVLWYLTGANLTSLADVKVMKTTSYVSDPLVGMAEYRDLSNNERIIILAHKSGLVEKLDAQYEVVQTVTLGSGVRSFTSDYVYSGRNGFYIVDNDGVLRRYNVADLTVSASNSTVVWRSVCADYLSLYGSPSIVGLSMSISDNAYSLNWTTLVATKINAPDSVQFTGISRSASNSTPTYLCGYDRSLNTLALYTINGVLLASSPTYTTDSYFLDYSDDTVQRVCKGSGQYAGTAKTAHLVAGGYEANLSVFFKPSATTYAYVGRRRKNAVTSYLVPTDAFVANDSKVSFVEGKFRIKVAGAGQYAMRVTVAPSIASSLKINGVTAVGIPYVVEGDVIELSPAAPQNIGDAFLVTIGRTPVQVKSDDTPDLFTLDSMFNCHLGIDSISETLHPVGFISTVVEYDYDVLIDGIRMPCPAAMVEGQSLAFVVRQSGDEDFHTAVLGDFTLHFTSYRWQKPQLDASSLRHRAYANNSREYISDAIQNTSGYDIDVVVVGGDLVGPESSTVADGQSFRLKFKVPTSPGHYTVTVLANGMKTAEWFIWSDAIYLDPPAAQTGVAKSRAVFDLPFPSIPNNFLFDYIVCEGTIPNIDGTDVRTVPDARSLNGERVYRQDATNATALKVQMEPQQDAKRIYFGDAVAYLSCPLVESTATARATKPIRTRIIAEGSHSQRVNSKSASALPVVVTSAVHPTDLGDWRNAQGHSYLSKAAGAGRRFPYASDDTQEEAFSAFLNEYSGLTARISEYRAPAPDVSHVATSAYVFESCEGRFAPPTVVYSKPAPDGAPVLINAYSIVAADSQYVTERQPRALSHLAYGAAASQHVLFAEPKPSLVPSSFLYHFELAMHEVSRPIHSALEPRSPQFFHIVPGTPQELKAVSFRAFQSIPVVPRAKRAASANPTQVVSRNLSIRTADPYGVPLLSVFVQQDVKHKELDAQRVQVLLSMSVVARWSVKHTSSPSTERPIFWQYVSNSVILAPSTVVHFAGATPASFNAYAPRRVSDIVHSAPRYLGKQTRSSVYKFEPATVNWTQSYHALVSKRFDFVSKEMLYVPVEDKVSLGYFGTELEALQNAVNVWGMSPDSVFALLQPSGLWTWAQVYSMDNACSDNKRGYISGG